MNTPIVPKYFRVVKLPEYAIDVYEVTSKPSTTIYDVDGTPRLAHGVDYFHYTGDRTDYINEGMMHFEFEADYTNEDDYVRVFVGIPKPSDSICMVERIEHSHYLIAIIPRKK
jgi:hypothetical protein